MAYRYSTIFYIINAKYRKKKKRDSRGLTEK